ncbi:MAG: ATP-binding protein [Candidatus Aenigmarchaeota archaeon]|nr:ATP-binding protein [Candidatus Aenigmarchaeota archaeon]
MRPELHELLVKWRLREKTFERDVEEGILPHISNQHAIFLTGPRRSGKSVVARHLLERLPGRIQTRYVNLEDPALIDALTLKTMDDFAEGLRATDCIVFDEVQLIPGWEKWVRRAVDTRQCKVIVAGSSAKLLSGEFSTALGGRGIGFQILPLSYKEFHRVTRRGLMEYIKIGGYPEVVLDPDKKEKLLESYFETALVKDIMSRYNVRDSNALRSLAFYLLTHAGKETSLKQLRSLTGLGYATIRRFIGYLEASFLIFQVPYFSYSLKESLTRKRKVYAYDLGMQQYASKSFSEDTGRLLEAAVAIELKHRQFEVYYWKMRQEVDFISRKKNDIQPINVCSAEHLPEREKRGLVEFCTAKKVSRARILYTGTHSTVEASGITISLENIEQWLLNE